MAWHVALCKHTLHWQHCGMPWHGMLWHAHVYPQLHDMLSGCELLFQACWAGFCVSLFSVPALPSSQTYLPHTRLSYHSIFIGLPPCPLPCSHLASSYYPPLLSLATSCTYLFIRHTYSPISLPVPRLVCIYPNFLLALFSSVAPSMP